PCRSLQSLFVPLMFLSIPEPAGRVKRTLEKNLFLVLKRRNAKGSKGHREAAICRPKEPTNMARMYKSRAWQDQLSPSLEEMEFLALETYATLPDTFRDLTGEIVIQVTEFPTEEIMDDLALET